MFCHHVNENKISATICVCILAESLTLLGRHLEAMSSPMSPCLGTPRTKAGGLREPHKRLMPRSPERILDLPDVTDEICKL